MLGILSRLGGEQDNFTIQERKIKEHIRKNLHEICNLSVQELADAAGVSKATISRFCRTLGYSNYREFSMALKLECEMDYGRINSALSKESSATEAIYSVLSTEIKALKETAEMLETNKLEEIVDVLLHCEMVTLFSIGGSNSVTLDFYHKLTRMGIPCVLQYDATFQEVLACQLTEKHVVIVASFSGYDAGMIHIVKKAKERGSTVVCLCNDYNAPLTKYSDYTLYGAFGDDFQYTGTTERRLSLMYIVDVLYTLLSIKGAPKTVQLLEQTSIILSKRAIPRQGQK